MPDAEPTPVWSLVANVVAERPYGPGGAEQRRGVRIFPPDAKVYVVGGFGGAGWETLTVIGRGRHAPGYVTANVRAEHLTNWRVQLVYSPAVLARMAGDDYQRWPFWDPAAAPPSSEAYRASLTELLRGFAG